MGMILLLMMEPEQSVIKTPSSNTNTVHIQDHHQPDEKNLEIKIELKKLKKKSVATPIYTDVQNL